jgi:hypothetical protein
VYPDTFFSAFGSGQNDPEPPQLIVTKILPIGGQSRSPTAVESGEDHREEESQEPGPGHRGGSAAGSDPE